MNEEKIKKIEKRKEEHIEKVLNNSIQYVKKSGLERVEFIHNALPEVDFHRINIKTTFLGKKMDAPMIIEGMTGGFKKGGEINRKLAESAEKHGIAFGLGSQRAMLRNRNDESYLIRKNAPNVILIGNIGAVQLKNYKIEDIEWLVSKVEADALAVHLNPLQEIIQPEGDRDFSGILKLIEKLCESIDVPVIAKETGAGINGKVAEKLFNAGVEYVDVAGSGGSSWSKVEYLRGGSVPGFEEWGLSTLECILQCRGKGKIIASGGIRSGIDVAKCIALGAEIAGAAYPFLISLSTGKLNKTIERWKEQIKICAFLTGSKNIEELKKAEVNIK
ncbi:MAG: type 2 isopentenyl-diphosphate Delta-isomerase [Bacteroidetes bacterium]|nr:MAG: type 2 isopentenyl-diphosphate Delta-isomerase [Bacteroidota bacterium]